MWRTLLQDSNSCVISRILRRAAQKDSFKRNVTLAAMCVSGGLHRCRFLQRVMSISIVGMSDGLLQLCAPSCLLLWCVEGCLCCALISWLQSQVRRCYEIFKLATL